MKVRLPNGAAITRLIGAILLEHHDEWAVQHDRYMPLGYGEPIGDSPTASIQKLAGPALGRIGVLTSVSYTMGNDLN